LNASAEKKGKKGGGVELSWIKKTEDNKKKTSSNSSGEETLQKGEGKKGEEGE